MYKIAILGCENSHANAFLGLIKEEACYSDIEVVGVYSPERAASEKLNEKYGVKILETPDECVGKIDGLIITARHGKFHYEWAKPYIKTGIPMFLDKPVTISEEDAINLVKDLTENNVAVCGGSSLRHVTYLHELREMIEKGEMGKPTSAFFRAPVNMVNEWGNFYFYAAHNVAMMTEVFGYYPKSVYAVKRDTGVECIVSYEDLDVHLSFVNGNYVYHGMVSFEKGCVGSDMTTTGIHAVEFAHFDSLLRGTGKSDDYKDLTASVFIMNAIERSMESGKPVQIGKLPE